MYLFCHPASRAYFCLFDWGREKEALLESLQAFEVAASRTPGLVNLVFSRQTGFFECKHPFVDKPMVITEPAVASAQLLGLGSKLYPSNMLRMLNKDLTRFMQSLNFSSTLKSSKRKKDSAGRQSGVLLFTCWGKLKRTMYYHLVLPVLLSPPPKIRKTFFCHIINPLLTKLVQLSLWPRSLFALGLYKCKEKLGQYAFIFTSRLG